MTPRSPEMPPAAVILPACEREVRPAGLLPCCRQMLTMSTRSTRTGTRAECPVCHAVCEVDAAGAWAWHPFATAEALRPHSLYGAS